MIKESFYHHALTRTLLVITNKFHWALPPSLYLLPSRACVNCQEHRLVSLSVTVKQASKLIVSR